VQAIAREAVPIAERGVSHRRSHLVGLVKKHLASTAFESVRVDALHRAYENIQAAMLGKRR